jgi:type II secretory ATPase GspE/PulE/Tfp pilus assembly ATPase PilB-like protein
MDKNKKNTEPPDSKKATARQAAPLRLGELLIKEGLVKEQDLEKALSVQKQEEEMQKLPLGEILVKIGALSESGLDDLLNHPDLRKQIGTLAVEKGLINNDQLQSCLRKKEPHQTLGEVLIQEGLATPDDIGRLLKEQINTPKIGELAVRLRLTSENYVAAAVRIQKSSRRLGEIFCDLNLVDPVDLNFVLSKYNKQLELRETIWALGYINEEQLNIVRQEQKHGKQSLEEILIRKKIITQKQLQIAQSKQLNIPFMELNEFVYGEHEKNTLAGIISQKYAEKNMILPISLKGSRLTLALFKPEHMQAIYELKGMFSHLNMSCILTTEEKFEELFEVLYSQHLGGTTSPGEAGSDADKSEVDFIELTLDEEIEGKDKGGPVYGARDIEAEELVNFIIKHGIVSGASDIHIEQDRTGVKLRYRLDGVLRETNIGWLKQKLREKAPAVISRIKIMSDLDIAEKRLPQDGVFRINYYDKAQNQKVQLDFRVATCRAIVGENITIRILDPRKANVGLENLNHSPHVLEPFRTLLKSSAGMVLVCGPTGSGKSSTLYAALQYIHNPGMKIITAEDPIEYAFPGIMQTQIHPKINLTFSRLLRSFLRLDPDVILIGEMRDEETVKIGFDAAQTGHLLLSTLHTNDAVSSVSRLIDLEVEHSQIASCLMCVLAQRLVRKICSSCIQEYVPDEDEWSMLFNAYPAHLRFFRGQGCEVCNFTGYKGRTLLSEIFVVDSEIAQALNKGLDEDGLKKLALESGMKTMLEDGLLKLEQTTLTEIIRMVPHDMMKAFRMRGQAQKDVDSLIESVMSGGGASNEADILRSSFHLSSPETQTPVIDLMKAKYESLKAQSGHDSGTVDPLLFKEFITDGFYHICEKHKCKSVTFNIENNQGGRPEISGIPDA